MATIIDSLIVTLGLDSGKFTAESAKVGTITAKTEKQFKTLGKESGGAFQSATAQATKFLALLGGTYAIKSFVSQTIDSSAALERFARNINEGVTKVSAWGNAAELAGGSASGLQGAFALISKAQTDLFATGESGLLPYLAALGNVSLASAGKARPVHEVLLDLADGFGKLDRQHAVNIGKMMGLDEGTINLLLKGRVEVERMVAEQERSNAVTKKQAEESERLRQVLVDGRQTIEAYGRELLSAATPAIEAFLAKTTELANWMRDNKEFITAWFTGIAVAIGVLTAATVPINLTAVAIAGVTAAIAALWQDFQVWKRGGDSLIDWDKWKPAFDAATEGLTVIRNLLSDIINRAIGAGDALIGIVRGDVGQVRRGVHNLIFGNEQSLLEGTNLGFGAIANKAPAPAPAPKPATSGKIDPLSFFQSQGWTKEQAAGIVANLKAESQLNPGAVGDSGKAYGIAQWHPDRQAAFRSRFGKDIKGSSLEEQLQFVQYELTQGSEQGAGSKLKAATTAAEAGQIVSRRYERPADREGEAYKRGLAASQLLNGIPGASVAAAQPAPANNSQRSTSVSIAKVEVHTQATDAQGIASDIGGALDRELTSQANYGLM